jgi:hypothetical protein
MRRLALAGSTAALAVIPNNSLGLNGGDLSGLVHFVIRLIVVGLIFWLIFWLVDYCAIPQPFNKIIKVVVAIVMVLYVISLLLAMAG